MATEKSKTDIERQILETQLETAQIALEEQRERNEAYKAKKKVAALTNAQRQAQFKADRLMTRNVQRDVCQHLAGGEAGGDPTQGGGKFAFSVLSRVIMPDGKTELIQCPRCRLKLYGRELSPAEREKLKDGKRVGPFETYEDFEWWTELRATSKKDGVPNNVMRGPTFMFQNEQGVNFIPDMR